MTGTPLPGMLLPDVPGCVHGIVSLDPPQVQCDGCGRIDTGSRLAVTVLRSDIGFLDRDDSRRMCGDCWAAEGRMTERVPWCKERTVKRDPRRRA